MPIPIRSSERNRSRVWALVSDIASLHSNCSVRSAPTCLPRWLLVQVVVLLRRNAPRSAAMAIASSVCYVVASRACARCLWFFLATTSWNWKLLYLLTLSALLALGLGSVPFEVEQGSDARDHSQANQYIQHRLVIPRQPSDDCAAIDMPHKGQRQETQSSTYGQRR